MSTSALENNEDLENVPLVKMEDVQPDRSANIFILNNMQVLEPCITKTVIDHDYSCIVNGDDVSNVKTVRVIQPMEVENDNDNTKVPQDTFPVVEEAIKIQHPIQDSWPTLEISPGGVIKHSEKYEDLTSLYTMSDIEDERELMYACAKCSQRFKFLFNLVKHVKWHEDQRKKQEELIKSNMYISRKKTHIHPKKKKVLKYKMKNKIADPNMKDQSVSLYHTSALRPYQSVATGSFTEHIRKRGRPRKLKSTDIIPIETQRRRGRPRKQPTF